MAKQFKYKPLFAIYKIAKIMIMDLKTKIKKI